ncbi:FAD-dependent oxidoreductase [Devosia sp.]|uniref:FAD-dependent oxidoreductase n=1 Tax=Devosia sp. TaxID=1871048 RepID=UPI003A8CC095
MANLRNQLDIAIVGAGPGGLATALFLHRAGHRATVFERFDTAHPVGSGLMLQPTGLAVLQALGLDGQIGQLGARVDRLTGTDSRSGRTVLDVGYAPLGPNVHALAVHRAALFNVLHSAVQRKGIALVTGFTATAMTTGETGHWLQSDRGREGPFDLIVDASGARSPLRVAARFPPKPRPLTYGAIWSTVPWVDSGFDRHALSQRYRKSSVMIGVLPVGRQTGDGPELAAFFWSLKPESYDGLRARGIAAWHDEVLSHWPETAPHLSHMASFEQMNLARYAHETLRVPAGTGIGFVGDSAHCTSPQLGQGANMALLDAAALATALDRAGSVAEALELYCRFRRWHVRFYQFMSLALTPFYQSDSRTLPFVRDVLVSGIGKLPPVAALLAQLVSGQMLRPLRAISLAPVTSADRAA